MDFDWHDNKSERNHRERGYDFRFAARAFLGRTVEFEDTCKDYGEVRMVAIGEIDGRLYKVVYPDRDGVRWIISSNPASRQEKRRWHERAWMSFGPTWPRPRRPTPRRAGSTSPRSTA